jgi:hypothetical protein
LPFGNDIEVIENVTLLRQHRIEFLGIEIKRVDLMTGVSQRRQRLSTNGGVKLSGSGWQ